MRGTNCTYTTSAIVDSKLQQKNKTVDLHFSCCPLERCAVSNHIENNETTLPDVSLKISSDNGDNFYFGVRLFTSRIKHTKEKKTKTKMFNNRQEKLMKYAKHFSSSDNTNDQ